MKKILFLLLFNALLIEGYSQNIFSVKIVDADTGEGLIGATASVSGTNSGAISGIDGSIILKDIPNGTHTIVFSYVGYRKKSVAYTFPFIADAATVVTLEEENESLKEVIVTSTRSTRTFGDIATRVEYIGGEELEEKGVMKPGDIRMLLNESTGIMTQQTSAISGNALIKIQGMDGRYTQILKDGFPIFSGAASGLGLLQTPPLDLRQVEVIKGSSSTLYGGGAIAGLVNLVSKIPQVEQDMQIQLNGTSGKGLDVSGFYGQRFGKIGTTVLTSYNRNWAYDPSNVGFSAIPQFDRFTLNPKLFLYFSDDTNLNIGLNATIEDRLGGDMEYLQSRQSKNHSYFEHNKTQRYSTQLFLEHHINKHHSIILKSSVNYFDRKIELPNYRFAGNQISSFSEACYTFANDKTEWVGGVNYWTENFDEHRSSQSQLRDYHQNTAGVFIQNNTKLLDGVTLETGLRGDWVEGYGFVALPRISFLFHINNHFSTRLGSGFGYKAPTIFSEESERLNFRNVLPIDKNYNLLEKSYGANIDFNYRIAFADGKLLFSINQLFFYTYLKKPLELQPEDNGYYRFNNLNGHFDSKGAETNAKLKCGDWSLYLGYTYTDAQMNNNGRRYVKHLTPRHQMNGVLVYEVEDSWKVGFETYYTGKQTLSDETEGWAFVTMGLMVQKIWEKISLYANFENFTDRRQTRFDTIYRGTMTDPIFRDIYAPLDGFVLNAGIVYKF